MKPTKLYKTDYNSPLGLIRLLADDNALIGSYFKGQAYFERGYEELEFRQEMNAPLALAIDWLDAYFAGEMAEQPPLAPRGTPFQLKVWQALQTIPTGQTVTYGQLAQQLQCRSARAIGGAVGKNPLSLFIPCHRVVGKGGLLTGYAGGLDKKIWLLNHEANLISH
ncbi:methylated-DNA--[protein]-cysteine S-methyltransferase [Streptococcus merionis]|uniref:methylated-DNA--[protein]-cysteine S-methyltransferase n=1 Tax=Streptococcus merionis TaxID=400065 RepID=UPI0026EF5589|nr:methylated-DNA--[protein]-cysteine S-methyltransferase [Streptococcus merionis]